MDTLFRINNEYPHPADGTRVIKAKDCGALYDAAGIIKAAQEKAAAIVKKAEVDYKARYDQGYQDGLEEGKMEHAEKVMETVLASVEFIEKIENTVVSVVNQSIRKIIGDLGDDERVRRIVGTALNNVRGQQRVTVRVSPKDEPAVSQSLAAMTSGSYLTVVADSRLEENSCILESELGVIDASLKTQLKALEKAFNSKIKA